MKNFTEPKKFRKGLLNEYRKGIFVYKQWGCWTSKNGKKCFAITKNFDNYKVYEINLDDYKKLYEDNNSSHEWIILHEKLLFGLITIKKVVQGLPTIKDNFYSKWVGL